MHNVSSICINEKWYTSRDMLTEKQVNKLAEDVSSKIRAKNEEIQKSEGEITIKIFPRGNGSEIKISITM